jgi:Ca2+:H+ antiporter
VSLFAILFLAKFVGDQTEIITDVVGEIIGGILNATFGNIFELLFSLISLFENTENSDKILLDVLIGGVVSNLLLVLGSSILLGGIKNGIQKVLNDNIHSTSVFILFISSIILTIPSLYMELNKSSEKDNNIKYINIIIAMSLFINFIYFSYFQLMNNDETIENTNNSTNDNYVDIEDSKNNTTWNTTLNSYQNTFAVNDTLNITIITNNAKKNIFYPIIMLFVGTTCVGFVADNLTNSIGNFNSNISQLVMSFTFLAFVGSVPEHYTAIIAAIEGKIDQVITIAITSSTQLLMLIPSILVFLGFFRSRNFSLVMPAYLLIAMNISTLCAYLVIQKQNITWIAGLQMMFIYSIIIVMICVW